MCKERAVAIGLFAASFGYSPDVTHADTGDVGACVNSSLPSCEDSRKWWDQLTGLDPTSIENVIDLGAMDPARCFPESEIANLCNLPFSEANTCSGDNAGVNLPVTSLFLYRDACPEDSKLQGTALRLIGWCLPNLEFIDLDFNNFSSLKDFPFLPRGIREISLGFNQGLADADFSPLQSLPNLTALSLQDVRLTQRALHSLRGNALQFIRIETDVAEDFDDLVHRFPSLRAIAVGKEPATRKLLHELFQHDGLVDVAVFDTKPMFPSPAHLSPETLNWMLSEARGLIVDSVNLPREQLADGTYGSNTELLRALEQAPNLRRIHVRRSVSAEEANALLRRPLDRLVLQDGIGKPDPFMDAARSLQDRVRVKELLMHNLLLWHTPTEEIESAFGASQTSVLSYVVGAMEANVPDLFVRCLTPRTGSDSDWWTPRTKQIRCPH